MRAHHWSAGVGDLTAVGAFTLAALLLVAVTPAGADAEKLYQEHCAVCHGADFGGYIGPGLNRDTLARHNEAYLRAKITTGGVGTLMPGHPLWSKRLTRQDIEELAALIKSTPVRDVAWDLDHVRSSLEVLVPNEASLPGSPTYRIDNIVDLMAVTARGHFASGPAAKIVFFNGKTNQVVGELATQYAPHIVNYHPTQARWAYATTDAGYLLKIDLYSFRVVRRIRVGLNGVSLAVSRDGRYVAAGSYVPNAAVILRSDTLEPVKLMQLRGTDLDGKDVESDSGVILATPFADYFVIALEQSGQVWIVDLASPDMHVTQIPNVGRHLHDAFLSPSGRHVVMSSYDDNIAVVIDLQEKQIIKRMPAGRKPHFGSGAVIKVGGKTLGFGTNIGAQPTGQSVVSVFDMDTFEVIKQIPVLGPTESPAAHPDAPYIVVDIVGRGPQTSKIQLIDKQTLEVVRTIDVGGHSQFPEYTADGRYLYVSAGYRGNKLVIYDSRTWRRVRSVSMEAPAGIFSHRRSRAVAIGLE
jgi:mono/diheme cytochrome c family protein/DNA-binding beta-propeller fold protein YncE